MFQIVRGSLLKLPNESTITFALMSLTYLVQSHLLLNNWPE